MSSTAGSGLGPRLASVLCYTVWWMTGLVFLVLERDQRRVRFHAAQSVVVFGAVSLALLALAALSVIALGAWPPAYPLVQRVSDLVWLGAVVLWILLMLKAWRGELWRVPVAARLADRIAGK